ncbi:hypothetical protein BGZ73_004048 [Actinomortierella ambigua]|nr:hypothetical protein BGZ73_004048 [Actinomortierella ambigua]
MDDELRRQWMEIQAINKSDMEHLNRSLFFGAYPSMQQITEHFPPTNDAVIIPNIEHQDLQPGRGACQTSFSSLSRDAISTEIPASTEASQKNDERPDKIVLKSILKRPQQSQSFLQPSSATGEQGTSFPAPKKSVHWNEVAHVREFYVVNSENNRAGMEDDMGGFGDDFGYRAGRHQSYHASDEGNGSAADGYEPEDRAAWFVDNLELNMNHRPVGLSTTGFEEEQDQLVPDSPIDAMPASPPLLSTFSSFSSDPQLHHEDSISPPPALPSEQPRHDTLDDEVPAKGSLQSDSSTHRDMGRDASSEPHTRTPVNPRHPHSTTVSKGRGLRVDTSGVTRPVSPFSSVLSPPISSPSYDQGFSPISSGPVSPPSSSSPMGAFSELFYGQGNKYRNGNDLSHAEGTSKDLSPAPTSPLPPVPSLEPVRAASPSRSKERELKSLSLNALSDDDLKAIGRLSAASYIHRLNEGAVAHNGCGDGSFETAPGHPSKGRAMVGMQRKRLSNFGKALPDLPPTNPATDDGFVPASSTSPFDSLTALNSAMNRGLPRLTGQISGRGYAPRLSPRQRPPRRGSLTITDLPPPKPLIPKKSGPPPSQRTSAPTLNAVNELHDSVLAEHPEEEEAGEEVEDQNNVVAEGANTMIPKNTMPVYSGKMFIRVLGFKALSLPSTSEPVYVHVHLRSNGGNPVSTPPMKLSKKTPFKHEFCIPVRASQELSLSVHVRPDDHVIQSLESSLTAHAERGDGSKVSKVLSKSRSLVALGNNSASKLRLAQVTKGKGGSGSSIPVSPSSPLQNRLLGTSGRRSFLPTLSSSFRQRNQHSPSVPSTSSGTSGTATTPASTSESPAASHPASLHGRSHSLDDQSLPMIMLSKFISRTDYCLAQSGTIHFDKIRKRLGEGNPVHWSFEMMNDWHSTILQEPATRNGSIKTVVDQTGGAGGGTAAPQSVRSSVSPSSASSTINTLVGVLELQLCYLPGVSVEGWRRDFYRIIGDALIQHDDSLRVLRAMDLSSAVDVKTTFTSSIASTPSSAPTSVSVPESSQEEANLPAGQLLSPPQSPTPVPPARPFLATPSSSSSSATYIAESAMGADMLHRQFVIEFAGGERVQLAADTEPERTQWIEAVRCVLDRTPLGVAT